MYRPGALVIGVVFCGVGGILGFGWGGWDRDDDHDNKGFCMDIVYLPILRNGGVLKMGFACLPTLLYGFIWVAHWQAFYSLYRSF